MVLERKRRSIRQILGLTATIAMAIAVLKFSDRSLGVSSSVTAMVVSSAMLWTFMLSNSGTLVGTDQLHDSRSHVSMDRRFAICGCKEPKRRNANHANQWHHSWFLLFFAVVFDPHAVERAPLARDRFYVDSQKAEALREKTRRWFRVHSSRYRPSRR